LAVALGVPEARDENITARMTASGIAISHLVERVSNGARIIPDVSRTGVELRERATRLRRERQPEDSSTQSRPVSIPIAKKIQPPRSTSRLSIRTPEGPKPITIWHFSVLIVSE
jgi:hypothetical protein